MKIILPKVYKRVLIISDLHIPYEHKDALKFLKAVKKKFKPDLVLSSGDEVDWHSISYHEKNPDLQSPKDEMEESRRRLKAYYKVFPNVYLMDSNHGSLAYRKAATAGLPSELVIKPNQIWNAPKGWKWVNDLIFKTPLGKVYICHGKTASVGKLSQHYGCSTIQGHFHEKSQIFYTSTPAHLIFDMHVGCLVDDSSKAMAYNKLNTKRPILSVGFIENGIPRIIPMLLNKKGRWINVL